MSFIQAPAGDAAAAPTAAGTEATPAAAEVPALETNTEAAEATAITGAAPGPIVGSDPAVAVEPESAVKSVSINYTFALYDTRIRRAYG